MPRTMADRLRWRAAEEKPPGAMQRSRMAGRVLLLHRMVRADVASLSSAPMVRISLKKPAFALALALSARSR